jgi:predicted transport protein
MSDIKLLRTVGKTVTQLDGHSVALERSLQSLIEGNLETFLGIRFLASEYSTGKTHAGRIDTLGIGENGCACIVEYKRSSNENVINQGLFYLDWLLDHKAEFESLVSKKFGQDTSDSIEWSSPRLICIAGDFTKYDGHAVQQIDRNIELIRYVRFGDEFLLFEMVHSVATAEATGSKPAKTAPSPGSTPAKSVEDQIARCSPELLDVYHELETFIMSLGDDVQKRTLKWYLAYRRIKNFVSLEFQYALNKMLVFVKVDPDELVIEAGFMRDVREIGHFGTGSLELTIRNREDLRKSLPLIEQSYDSN